MVERTGIAFWLDPDGQKKKELEIHYPAARYAPLDVTRGGFWQSMSDTQKEKVNNKIEQMKNDVIVVDNRLIDSHLFPSDSAEGFAAALAESNGLLSFEFRIPLHLEEYFPKFSSLAGKEKIMLGMNFVQAFADRAPATPFGGAMTPYGRGMSRRMRGERSSANSDLWVEVLLAKPS
jgi:hypothetical protein